MVYTGPTPTRQGGFDFGAYIGESLGKGFSSGLQKTMESSFEQSAIDKALGGLPENATSDQKVEAVLRSKASAQTKAQWMQYLKLQQKAISKAVAAKEGEKGSNREAVEKYLGAAATSSDRVASMTKDMEPMQRERLLNKIDNDIKQNPDVPMQTIVNKNLQSLMDGTLYQEISPQAQQEELLKKPETMPQPKKGILEKAQEGNIWSEEGREKLWKNIKGSPGVLGIRQSAVGDMMGISNLSAEDIATIGKMDPAEHLLMNASSLAADYAPYAKAIKAYGALKGFAIMDGARSLFKDIYKEIKKEGPTTASDIKRIVKNALGKAAKGYVTGAVFDKIPGLSKTLENLGVPKQLVGKAAFEGVSRLLTTGTALSVLNPLLEGRVTNLNDIEEAFASATLMEAMHIPQEARAGMPPAEEAARPSEPSAPPPAPERPPSFPLTGEQAAELQKLQTPGEPKPPAPSEPRAPTDRAPPEEAAKAVRDIQEEIKKHPEKAAELNLKLVEAQNRMLFGKTQPIEERAAELPKEQAPSEPKPLAGRVEKGPAEGPTPLRTERVEPEKRLYRTEEQMQLREEQLKKYPEKEVEILADQAEKAQRSLKKPETVTTMASKQEAAQRLNEDNASFEEAVRSVRALENQMAAHPEKAAQIEPRLRHAKNQLFFAENQLKMTLQNMKTGEGRMSAKEMVEASEKKLASITDMLTQGKEVVFADDLPKGTKFDPTKGILLNRNNYSSERVKAAENLSKQEQLRANKQNDFYTDVHEQYNKQYEKRLADIESAIARENAKPKPSKEMLGTLAKEKEVVGKMLKHNKADILMHRHKLALREMHQRKQFAEKMQKMKPAEMNKKVKEVSDRAIKYFEKPTAENLEKLSEESGIPKEELKEGLKQAEEAAKESAEENLKETIEEPKKEKTEETKKESKSENLSDTIKEQAKKRDEKEQEKQQPKKTTNLALERFKKDLEDLWKNKRFLNTWWRNPLGRQLFLLAAVEGYNAMAEEPSDKISFASVAAISGVISGRSGYSFINPIVSLIKQQISNQVSKSRVEEYIKVSSGPNPNYRRKYELEQQMTPKEKKKAKEHFK